MQISFPPHPLSTRYHLHNNTCAKLPNFLDVSPRTCVQNIFPRRDVSSFSEEGIYFNWRFALGLHQDPFVLHQYLFGSHKFLGETSHYAHCTTSNYQLLNTTLFSVWLWSISCKVHLIQFFTQSYQDCHGCAFWYWSWLIMYSNLDAVFSHYSDVTLNLESPYPHPILLSSWLIWILINSSW